ncbi:MAG: hypothetical protein VR78_08810 [Hoeflea sp. BRH_c9]|nr:MAG: hypothetical protein VR78_08810 [Hoeflea sp. BRH_c9]
MKYAVRCCAGDHRAALGPWVCMQRIDAVGEKVSDASDFFNWFEKLMGSVWISSLYICPPVRNHGALQNLLLKSSSLQVVSHRIFEKRPADQYLSDLELEIV